MPTVPSATETTPLALDAPELYINRELSWLAFNARVLAQAADPRQPLLERVKFLAIVGSNLDEFFMIRVATLQKQMRTGRESISPDGLTTHQQLTIVRERALAMLAEQGADVGAAVAPRARRPRASPSSIHRTTPTRLPPTCAITSPARSLRC